MEINGDKMESQKTMYSKISRSGSQYTTYVLGWENVNFVAIAFTF